MTQLLQFQDMLLYTREKAKLVKLNIHNFLETYMYIRYIIILLYYICWASFPLGASPIAQEEKPTDSLYQTSHFFHTQSAGKVYLHFDNTSYFMRESIWYKANIVNAETLIPEVKSKILYVDLFNQEGVIVKRNRHYIKKECVRGVSIFQTH